MVMHVSICATALLLQCKRWCVQQEPLKEENASVSLRLSLSVSYLMLGGGVGGGVWSKHGVKLLSCGRESAVNTKAVTTRCTWCTLLRTTFKQSKALAFFP